MREELRYYSKAVLGFIAPGAVVIGSSVLATSDGGTLITMAEWVTAGVASVVTAAAVAGKSNGPKPNGRHEAANE